MVDGFSLKIGGLDEFRRSMDDAVRLFERPTDFIAQPLEDWLADTEREQFDSEGAAGASGRWKELSPQTLRERALEGRGFQILQRTGAMANVLTRRGSILQLVEVTDDRIIFHLPSPAGYHQSGTRRMPQRKVFDPSDRQLRRLEGVLTREAAMALRRIGFEVRE